MVARSSLKAIPFNVRWRRGGGGAGIVLIREPFSFKPRHLPLLVYDTYKFRYLQPSVLTINLLLSFSWVVFRYNFMHGLLALFLKIAVKTKTKKAKTSLLPVSFSCRLPSCTRRWRHTWLRLKELRFYDLTLVWQPSNTNALTACHVL